MLAQLPVRGAEFLSNIRDNSKTATGAIVFTQIAQLAGVPGGCR
jgi:hypothetical protein